MFKIFINFKTYSQATGENAVKLAKICEGIGSLGGSGRVEIIPVVQAVDLFRITTEVKIPVWVQHLDPQLPGPFTGWENLEAIIEAGAAGTLLNHSEHQVSPGTIKQTLARIRNSKLKIRNFQVMVCCKTLGQMERLVKLKPDFIAYEISELIASNTSITDSNPKAIQHAVEICKGIPLIVGAGIHKAEDLVKAKKFGAKGVLISSAVVLAENPKNKLLELIKLLSVN